TIAPAQPNLWSRDLRWSKQGPEVTIFGKTLRRSGAGSPGQGSRLYDLPGFLRPTEEWMTPAISMRQNYSMRGIYTIRVLPDGGVFIYNSDPDLSIIENTSYHFSLTYATAS